MEISMTKSQSVQKWRFPHIIKSSLTLIPLLTVFLVFNSQTLFAGYGSISGKVIDKQTDETLIGAIVEIVKDAENPGKKLGAITKNDGTFKIKRIKPGPYILSVSYIGYKHFKLKVNVVDGKDETVAVQLIQDIVGLDEIVVTGVASRTEKGVSDVSVAKINADELKELNPYQDVSQFITGKVSGVQVETSSGNVGGGVRFQVRGGGGLNGTGQPVIFVDGVRVDNTEIGFAVGGQLASTLSDLNPEDIENIEILKGPAGGALYGTSGSNGVVLITTKRGKGRFKVNYKMVSGWHEAQKEYSEDMFLSYKDANAIMRSGNINEHNISFSGTSGIFNYYAGYTNRNEEGIVLLNDYGRESIQANFDVTPTKEVSIKLSGNYTWSENNRSQNDNNVIGWLGNTLIFPQSYIFSDSVAVANMTDIIHTKTFRGSIQLNYMPDYLPGLSFYGNIGYNGINYTDEQFQSPLYFYPGTENKGDKQIYNNSRDLLNYDFNASYDFKPLETLELQSVVGAQLHSRRSIYSQFEMQGFGTPLITNYSSADDFILSEDGLSEFREAGIFFNEYINYSDFLFGTIAIRNDYSSVVGEKAPNILYPRLSAAIRLDRLGYAPDMMNMLKLRLAYGESGQLPGLLAAQALRWGPGQSGWGAGGVVVSIGNPEIEPERIKEYELGLEIQLMDAYGIDFTYYTQSADKSILSFPNPPSSGLTATSVPMNVGAIDVWGLESSIYGAPIISKDYRLDLRFNFSWQDNEVKSLGGAQPILGSFGELGNYVGYQRSSFFDYKVIGATFDEDGVYNGLKYSEYDDDGNPKKVYLGNPLPKYNLSFSASFKFLKYFTVYMLVESAMGHYISNQTRTFQVRYGNDVEYNNLSDKLYGNADEGIEALTPGTDEYINTANALALLHPDWSSNFIEEADWVRIRDLSFRIDAYDFLDDFLENTYVKDLNFVFSIHNASLWTGYSGIDPQVNFDGSRTTVTRGVDFLTLQSPRTYNFQIVVGF